MKHLKEFIIQFEGLKTGMHQFKYLIEKKFFESYQYDDFIESNIKVVLDFNKKDSLFELYFKANGTVLINCDVSGEEYNQVIHGELKLIVNFGNEFNDEHEDILIIPRNDYQLNVAQYIYELIVLNVPVKRIHPKVIDGTLKSEALDKLKKFQRQSEKKEIDPRWDKLKELIKD